MVHPRNETRNLFEIINNNSDDNDLSVKVLNELFPNLDTKDVSQYHDINSLNNILNDNNNSLTFLHLNMRSLAKKLDSLDALVNSFSHVPDVIALSETWLKEKNSKHYCLDGYTAYHLTRSNKKGGGVSLLVKSNIDSDLIDEFSFIGKDLEICTIRMRVNCVHSDQPKTYVVSCIYRPDSKTKNVGKFKEALNVILSNNIFTNNNSLLLGDFNIDLLNYLKLKPTEQYLTHMQSNNYYELISRPTRFPVNQRGNKAKPSLLDHIYSNFSTEFISGILTLPLSDHLPTFLVLPTTKPKTELTKVQFRLFDRVSREQFTRALCAISWEELLTSPSVDTNFDIFHNKLTSLYNRFFHIKTKTLRHDTVNSPWLSSGIMKSIKTKNKLYKKYLLKLIPYAEYTIYSNRLKTIIKAVQYFSNFKQSLKKSWETINHITTGKRSSSSRKRNPISVNGVITNDPKVIAEDFNEHFSKIALKLDESLPSPCTDPLSYLSGDYPHSMVVPPVGIDDIIRTIRSLKNKNTGVHNISIHILKENCHLIASALKILFNQSITTGIFPSSLKTATVIPLHKSNSTLDKSNYRPISLLSVFSKIFEKLMMTSLSKYLNDKEIIHPSQYGFQAKKSTQTALQQFSQYLYENLDEGNSVLSIFIDYSKAFDTVSIPILISKLQHYGIRGNVLSWLQSFLTGRSQATMVGGIRSKENKIDFGVAQGSILGPVLFLLYINDLPNISELFRYCLYADDSTLYLSGKNPAQLISSANNELHKLYYWCTANRLTLNFSKSHFLIFSNKKIKEKLPPIVIKNYFQYQVLTRVDHFKFLGVIYDERLTFKYHTSKLTNKLSFIAAMLNKAKDFLPSFILKILYYAHVNSSLHYCIPIWANTSISHLQSLILMQKRIIRIISQSHYLDHTQPLFKEHRILKLTDLSRFSNIVEYFKYIPQPVNPAHNYHTRHRHAYIPPRRNTALAERSFTHLAPIHFHQLPQRLKSIRTLPAFKRQLKQYLFSKY